MKKLGIGIIITILIIILYSYTHYTIKGDQESIEKAIVNFSESVSEIQILEMTEIDNTKIIFFETRGILGDARLIRGLNGRYRIGYVGTGDAQPFIDRVEETNKGKYAVIRGKNYNLNIGRLSFTVNSIEYSLDVPRSEYFIIYTSVSKETKYPALSDLRIYDISNNDITMNVIERYRKKLLD